MIKPIGVDQTFLSLSGFWAGLVWSCFGAGASGKFARSGWLWAVVIEPTRKSIAVASIVLVGIFIAASYHAFSDAGDVLSTYLFSPASADFFQVLPSEQTEVFVEAFLRT